MTWILRPGVALTRRDAHHLQLGLDPPLRAVLPDSPGVRALLVELAHGGPLTALDAVTAPVLDTLVSAGLVQSTAGLARRAERRAASCVLVDAPHDVGEQLATELLANGLRVAHEAGEESVALLWSLGEPSRSRLEGWVRSSTPHLVVRELPDGPLVGPFVAPGHSACLGCLDAARGEADPLRSRLVEQQASTPPPRPLRPDPGVRALALAWAVHDLTVAADGRRPASWSATVALGSPTPSLVVHRRHQHCGCTWADQLEDRPRAG